MAASCAPKRLEPRIQSGTCEPAPGVGLHRLAGLRVGEVALQLDDVLRERVGAARVAAQRAHRQLVGARRAAEAEVDAAGVERLERAELLGDHERRVVRQHDAAGADADRLGAAGDVRDHDGGRRARDARSRCDARRARSACSPSARRAARGRASCGAPRSAVAPSTIGARSSTESGGIGILEKSADRGRGGRRPCSRAAFRDSS